MLVSLLKLFTLVIGSIVLVIIVKHKPHWVIYFIVFNIFSGIDPQLPGFSLRTYLIALLVVIDILQRRYPNPQVSYQYNNFFSREFKWIYYFIFWAFFVDIILAPIVGNIAGKDILSVLVSFFKGLIAWYLIIYYFQKYINTEKKLNIVFLISFISITIPSILAIMQFFNIEIGTYLSLFLASVPAEILHSIQIGRYSGNVSFLTLAYLLIPVFFFLIYYYLAKKRRFIIVLIGIAFVTLIINQTRSAIFGILIGLIVFMGFYRKGFMKKLIIPFAIIIVVVFIFRVDKMILGSERLNIVKYKGRSSLLYESIYGRINLFIPTFYTILKHPVGVGRANFREEVNEFSYLVDREFYGTFLGTTAHNQFLTIGGYYGVLSIFFMIMLYVYIFSRLIKTKFNNNNLNILRFALIGWLVAYIINGQVHNSYPYGAKNFAIVLGVFYSLMNLNKQEKFSE